MRPQPQSDYEIDTEARVLKAPEGQALLAAIAEVVEPSPADVTRWRKAAPAEFVAAALRLAQSQRRGRAKFSRASAMWLEPTALEQATTELVAQHKAKRFGDALTVDLCAGIGGDTLALAARAQVLSVDSDIGMCRRCAWNANAYDVAARVAVIRARAESFGLPNGALVHIDPDRRATEKRTRALAIRDYEPGLPFLRERARSAPGGAIKLSPASDFAAEFDDSRLEVELVSLEGECKEATVWFGSLATCRRRATCLPSGASWTDRDAPEIKSKRSPLTESLVLADWVFAPDSALARVGLLDHFAAAFNLRRVRKGIDLLTGPERLASPFLTTYIVLAELPLDPRHLRKAVSERLIGNLELIPRGLSLPAEFARSLRASGPNRATLFCVGGPGPRRAIFARREG